MRDFSVRDIAERIKRPYEEIGTVVDRIRGWTDVGLIKVIGSKFPGTGSRRRYGPEAIVDAITLTALTDAGLAAVRVAHFEGASGQTVLQFGRLGAADVFSPDLSTNVGVHLVIAGSPKASEQTVYVARTEPQFRDNPQLTTPHLQLRGPTDVRLPPDATWSVVLNLRAIFAPFRTTLRIVFNPEIGRVEVEFIAPEQ